MNIKFINYVLSVMEEDKKNSEEIRDMIHQDRLNADEGSEEDIDLAFEEREVREQLNDIENLICQFKRYARLYKDWEEE